jgi:hypothetical protein
VARRMREMCHQQVFEFANSALTRATQAICGADGIGTPETPLLRKMWLNPVTREKERHSPVCGAAVEQAT